jgi:predicted metal-binding membrane protein
LGGVSLGSPAVIDRGRGRDELAGTLAAARARLGLVTLLFALGGLGWWLTARRMAGMDAGPGTDLGTLGWFLGVWIVMMAAMMLPSVSPTVALYAKMARRPGLSRPLVFTGGYLALWGGAGVLAYAAFRLGRSLSGEALGWHRAGQWFAAAVLLAAAIYELTPLKYACLQKCRSPLGFLLGTWRDGAGGAFQMGARHGAWCLGCCWALMAALFALGVMSLAWMAVTAALITLEKALPWRRVATWSTTAVLMALAVGLALAPHSVPGLVVPAGAHPGVHSMQMTP